MASLEKIRSKAVLLTVIIGLGLLAFIIEDGVQASRSFFQDNTAAKVGGDKIDIMEFQKRNEKLSAQNQNNPNKQDPAVQQSQLLDQMIFEKLTEQEFDKVGIYVSDSELSENMVGKNPSQLAIQFAQQGGFESPAQVQDLLTNPAKYQVQESQLTEMKAAWADVQEQVVQQLLLQKLAILVQGSLQANDLDRKQMQEDADVTNYIEFVKKDYASLDDNKYPVTDAELKAEYDKCKAMFKLDEEMRTVHFISVPVDPSNADNQRAEKAINDAINALQTKPGLSGVATMSDFKVDSAKLNSSMLQQGADSVLVSFVKSAAVNQVARGKETGRTTPIYKMLRRENLVDSMEIATVVVQGDKKTQDQVLGLINAGNMAEAQKVKGVQIQEATKQPVLNAADSILSKLNAATLGTFFAMQQTDKGAMFVNVVSKNAPKEFCTVGMIGYENYASQATIDNITNKLQNFLNKNKTAAAFAKNAVAAGYTPQEVQVTGSTPQLGGVSDTRKAIKWAFDSKVGEVSPIFSDNKDNLVVVALDEVFKGEYLPLSNKNVKEFITKRVRNSKKGDDLMKQYKGKANDLAGYAKLMGGQVDTTQVNFGQDMMPKISGEYAEGGLLGRISASKPNTLIGPFKGEGAVYVCRITKQEKSPRQRTKEELDAEYARTRGGQAIANPQAFYNILSQAAGVKKNLIKFY